MTTGRINQVARKHVQRTCVTPHPRGAGIMQREHRAQALCPHELLLTLKPSAMKWHLWLKHELSL